MKCILGLLVLGLVQANPARNEDIGFASDIKRELRVSGGWPAAEGQFPFQASLRMVTSAGAVIGCGGVVIHEEWVLTAAHCLATRLWYLVRLGTVNLMRPQYVFELLPDDVVFHPAFDVTNANRVQQNDVALMNLGYKLTFGPNLQPVRLQNSQQKNTNYEGKVATLSGFGYDNDWWADGAVLSDIMLWTYLRLMNNDECRDYYTSVFDTTVCARHYNVTIQNACNGDSGGPLTIEDEDGQKTMIGIVQFGTWRGCAAGWPTAYVRPGHYHDWFQQVIGVSLDWSFDAQLGDN